MAARDSAASATVSARASAGSGASSSSSAPATATLRSRTSVQSCVVCQEAFDAGASVCQLPCQHLFHADCVLSWLKLRNNCPVCRWELPTADKDYEARRAAAGVSEASFASWYG